MTTSLILFFAFIFIIILVITLYIKDDEINSLKWRVSSYKTESSMDRAELRYLKDYYKNKKDHDDEFMDAQTKQNLEMIFKHKDAILDVEHRLNERCFTDKSKAGPCLDNLTVCTEGTTEDPIIHASTCKVNK